MLTMQRYFKVWLYNEERWLNDKDDFTKYLEFNWYISGKMKDVAFVEPRDTGLNIAIVYEDENGHFRCPN